MAAEQTGSLLAFGAPLERARGAVILVHGRGASAQSMVPLAEALMADDLAYRAPQAPGGTWYPYSFLAPLEQNEPHLSRALALLGETLSAIETAGVGAERVMLVGFSQGACLALEFAARAARRYAGVAALSGGLIGPPGAPRDYPGNLSGTPVFLGCSDMDPHIPKERVLESERVLRGMGGLVTARLYPGMGHTVNSDEISALIGMARAIPGAPKLH
jgi:phospholipase/carboxylesterase